jgi:hypothetical protein
MQKRLRKHYMTIVKVVEGSEIYNFPIHHLVHFYSKFWSFTCSNSGTVKRIRASQRRVVLRAAPPRCPSTFPRSPCTKASWSLRDMRLLTVRTVRVRWADRRSVLDPLPLAHTDWGRRRTTTASSPSSGRHRRARTLFKAVHSPRAGATPPPLLPLHRACHGRRLASFRPCSPFLAAAHESISLGTGSTSSGRAFPGVAPLSPEPQAVAAGADCYHRAPSLGQPRPQLRVRTDLRWPPWPFPPIPQPRAPPASPDFSRPRRLAV